MQISVFTSLVLALAALSAPTAIARVVVDGPNQACGTSTIHPANGSSSSGFSNVSPGASETKARENLRRKLGIQSGVICSICEDDGIQCGRTAMEFGTISTTPGAWDPILVGWVSTATYTGSYFVTCAVCPEVEV